jgi:hypothetical protein
MEINNKISKIQEMKVEYGKIKDSLPKGKVNRTIHFLVRKFQNFFEQ